MVEGRQEAVLAILEQLVERPPRDTRARHDVRDRHIPHALLAHQLHHRTEDSRALQLADAALADPAHQTRAVRAVSLPARLASGAAGRATPRTRNHPTPARHRQHHTCGNDPALGR